MSSCQQLHLHSEQLLKVCLIMGTLKHVSLSSAWVLRVIYKWSRWDDVYHDELCVKVHLLHQEAQDFRKEMRTWLWRFNITKSYCMCTNYEFKWKTSSEKRLFNEIFSMTSYTRLSLLSLPLDCIDVNVTCNFVPRFWCLLIAMLYVDIHI